MTNEQVFFGIAGIMVTLFIAFGGFFKYYLDAKVDPVSKNVDQLVHFMMDHHDRLARVEERTK